MRRAGRPTKKEEKEIKSKIWNLLSQGFEVPYIVAQTGYDKDTVYKYKKEFNDEFYSNQTTDRSEIPQRMSNYYDTLIGKAQSICKRLEKDADRYTENQQQVPRYIYTELRGTLIDMANIGAKKWALLNSNPDEDTE
ncbi:hypothetical protein [Candidatus Nitrosotenuis cloacae]|uniref:Uncharacterized protein n=1 Tax=Candidatus Nitrosotenuis cloacae TaxID=1603555 RepID=A0A3G1B356_9ARCH|nr:hypothetical protein [Candidatus Nitrosotenuis cloacae]AJZ75176.1 hypothetical protein SU86_000875 [Candidatus Nitrosotenuis cloacae]